MPSPNAQQGKPCNTVRPLQSQPGSLSDPRLPQHRAMRCVLSRMADRIFGSLDHQQRDRFVTLDGMRGFAAIAVALYHWGLAGHQAFPAGYLAVDFFFALSGFVIAMSYTQRLATTMDWRAFLKVRLIRLYPLYFAGFAVGIAAMLAPIVIGKNPPDPFLQMASRLVFGLFLLPEPFTGPKLFPLNEPAWSLFFELLVNVAFAAALYKARARWLIALMLVSALALLLLLDEPYLFDVGVSWATSPAGLLRTIFSFTLGILLYRLLPRPGFSIGALALVPVGLLLLIFACDFGDNQLAFEFLSVFLVFPLLMLAGIVLEPPALVRPLFQFLGDISYALYAIHAPLMAFLAYGLARTPLPPVAQAAVYVGIVILASWLCVKYFDKPVRRLIGALSDARRSAPAQVV